MLNKGDNQEQVVGDGSCGIQSVRDTNIMVMGLSFTETRELFMMLWEQNAPLLREDARKIAESYVDDITKKFEASLLRKYEQIEIQKLSDPLVQSMINDAVQASAKKGEKAHPEMLAEILTFKLSQSDDDLTDIFYSQALDIVPNITKKQIQFLYAISLLPTINITIEESNLSLIHI